MELNNNKTGIVIVVLSLVATIAMFLMVEPIKQNPDYHAFSDIHTILSIPNFLNVLSNIPFLLVGLLGLYQLCCKNGLTIMTENKSIYFIYYPR